MHYPNNNLEQLACRDATTTFGNGDSQCTQAVNDEIDSIRSSGRMRSQNSSSQEISA
ncbi:MAG: hypothetical protein ACYTXT_01670 [Nostoc sp.]